MAAKKTALITGCSPGGIGHSLAKELHQRGLHVFATARRVEQISDLRELGINCVSLVVDDHESVVACHGQVKKLLDGQGLDYLVNNAGKTTKHPAVELEMDEVKDMFSANVFGVMDVTQTFAPQVLQAKGTIVNVGSVGGHMPVPFDSAYAATKAALYAYSDCLRLEMSPFDVKVVYIQTGIVKTHIIRERTRLRPDSLYKPIEATFRSTQEFPDKNGASPDEFAKGLARDLLGRQKNVLWIGPGSFVSWFFIMLEYWLPLKLLPRIFARIYGITQLAKIKKSQ